MAEVVSQKMYKLFTELQTEYKYDFKLLNSVMQVNERQKTMFLVDKVRTYFDGNLRRKKIRCMGISI